MIKEGCYVLASRFSWGLDKSSVLESSERIHPQADQAPTCRAALWLAPTDVRCGIVGAADLLVACCWVDSAPIGAACVSAVDILVALVCAAGAASAAADLAGAAGLACRVAAHSAAVAAADKLVARAAGIGAVCVFVAFVRAGAALG